MKIYAVEIEDGISGAKKKIAYYSYKWTAWVKANEARKKYADKFHRVNLVEIKVDEEFCKNG